VDVTLKPVEARGPTETGLGAPFGHVLQSYQTHPHYQGFTRSHRHPHKRSSAARYLFHGSGADDSVAWQPLFEGIVSTSAWLGPYSIADAHTPARACT